MTNTVLTYFRSYKDYFWQWEDGTHVVAIPKNATIAYREHLGDIIGKLLPNGLPPFGSLLLAMIATNPHGSASLDVVYKIITTSIGTTDNITVTKAVSFLKLLSEVPAEYKQREKRILLLQTIFHRCHQIVSVNNSRNIYAFYREGGDEFDKMAGQVAFDFNVFDTDFRTLAVLESKFSSVDEIIKKIASIPDPKQIPIEFEEKVGSEESVAKDLIDQLIENNKTFHIGSLVRWLWAGLNIPVHSALPSEQPLGGISDLTNKGEFDKLLISEFAYDDLTFLSRLANNEALYFHREIPPTQNDLHRVILIDSSLRNWGNPRSIAFAVMLAIARHPKTDIRCEAYVIGDEKYYPISFDSVHQLIDALMIIDAGLTAAGGLELFLKDHGADPNKEIFLITESSGLHQATLLRVMNENSDSLNYVILTDDEGNVDVYKKHQRSRKHVQHIKVPLEALWKKTLPPQPDRLQTTLQRTDYPILFRDAGSKKCFLKAPDGEIFQVNEEKSILRFYDRNAEKYAKGWDVVFEGLPFRTEVAEVGTTPEGHYVFLLFNINTRQIFFVNINTGWTNSFVFDEWRASQNVSFVFDTWKSGDAEKSFVHTNNYSSWKINLDGKVEHSQHRIDAAVLKERERVLHETRKRYHYGTAVFRNVRSVFIDENRTLVFNTHGIQLTSQNHIKLVSSVTKQSTIESRRLTEQEFRFPDGSTVSVNRLGMFILKSSDAKLPSIYIPSALDAALGIFAGGDFAGNTFYFKEPGCEVILHDAGPERSKIVKDIMRTFPDRQYPELKQMIDHPPSNFGVVSMARARELKKNVEKWGARVELRAEGDHGSTNVIDTAAFFAKYINAFINTIIKHGA
jgi:hypothetical protein